MVNFLMGAGFDLPVSAFDQKGKHAEFTKVLSKYPISQ